MKLNVEQEVQALQQLSLRDLGVRYAALFGDSPRTRNKVWLVRRLAWRLQALAEGDLSERARRRAAELAHDADLRVVLPRAPRVPLPPSTTLPKAGTVLTRVYKGVTLEVQVRDDGFEWQGRRFASLSAVAQAITGAHWNGRRFFGLDRKGGTR
jgi:Protein of unknown function (DUF2924)